MRLDFELGSALIVVLILMSLTGCTPAEELEESAAVEETTTEETTTEETTPEETTPEEEPQQEELITEGVAATEQAENRRVYEERSKVYDGTGPSPWVQGQIDDANEKGYAKPTPTNMCHTAGSTCKNIEGDVEAQWKANGQPSEPKPASQLEMEAKSKAWEDKHGSK